MHRKRVCFVDDSKREIRRFRRQFRKYFTLYCGTTFDDVKARLGQRIPDLFVLDLYFPYDDESKLTRKLFLAVWDLPNPKRLYTTKVDVLLERVWGIVVSTRRSMDILLKIICQGPRGGIDNMALVREVYPNVPIVVYTRKGNLENAVDCMRLGAVDVIYKPQRLTRTMTQLIFNRFNMAMKDEWHSLELMERSIRASKKMNAETKQRAIKLLSDLRRCLLENDRSSARSWISDLKQLVPKDVKVELNLAKFG